MGKQKAKKEKKEAEEDWLNFSMSVLSGEKSEEIEGLLTGTSN